MAKAQEKNEDQLELDIQIEEDKPEKEETVEEVATEEGKPQQEVSEPEGDQEDEHEEYSIGVKKRIDKLTYKMREAERREQEAMEFAKSVTSSPNLLSLVIPSLLSTILPF